MNRLIVARQVCAYYSNIALTKIILCNFALSVNLQNLAEEKIVLNTIFNLILFQSGYGLGIMDKQRESN